MYMYMCICTCMILLPSWIHSKVLSNEYGILLIIWNAVLIERMTLLIECKAFLKKIWTGATPWWAYIYIHIIQNRSIYIHIYIVPNRGHSVDELNQALVSSRESISHVIRRRDLYISRKRALYIPQGALYVWKILVQVEWAEQSQETACTINIESLIESSFLHTELFLGHIQHTDRTPSQNNQRSPTFYPGQLCGRVSTHYGKKQQDVFDKNFADRIAGRI